MDIGVIAVAVLAVLGSLMFLTPAMCTKADRRDDPDAVAQVKKLGTTLIAAAAIAALMMLKYKLF